METHDSNVYPTILRGVLLGFWTPFLDLGARSAIFWHLKMVTFAELTKQYYKVFLATLVALHFTPVSR